MREIKFRGKRIDSGEWINGLPAFNRDCSGIDKIEVPMLSGGKCTLVDPETVGQFTGLKDKNGKEIYEGDILRYTFDGVTKVNVIEFQPPMFTYKDSMRWSLHQDKVIGNIYENPELLK